MAKGIDSRPRYFEFFGFYHWKNNITQWFNIISSPMRIPLMDFDWSKLRVKHFETTLVLKLKMIFLNKFSCMLQIYYILGYFLFWRSLAWYQHEQIPNRAGSQRLLSFTLLFAQYSASQRCSLPSSTQIMISQCAQGWCSGFCYKTNHCLFIKGYIASPLT